MIQAVGFSQMPFIKLRTFPSHVAGKYYQEWMWALSFAFSASIELITWFYFLDFKYGELHWFVR